MRESRSQSGKRFPRLEFPEVGLEFPEVGLEFPEVGHICRQKIDGEGFAINHHRQQVLIIA
jgi:hypothetical protein